MGKTTFYFFDVGVARALSRLLEIPLQPHTSAYGDTFEHFVILEFYRLASMLRPDYELTYLKTKDDAEIDLVIDRPARPPVLIEIKSTNSVNETHTKTLHAFASDLSGAEAYCLSQDSVQKQWGQVICLPWEEGVRTILGLS